MKIKQHLVITNPDAFLRGDYTDCFTLYDSPSDTIDGWIDCGEIELNVQVDTGAALIKVTAAIDKQMEKERTEFSQRMEILDRRKQELQALTYQESSDE